MSRRAAAFVAAGSRLCRSGQPRSFGIEADVHTTSDGSFIIIHGDNADRTEGRKGAWTIPTAPRARKDPSEMFRVMFICHGNICRSPMAEYIFNDMVQRLGSADRLCADSCAVSREEIGNPVYPPARAELEAHGVKCGAHRARQLTREDYGRCDMLVCMDESNVSRALRLLGGDPEGKLHLLGDFSGRGAVSDPWYTGDFARTFDDIAAGVAALIDKLVEAN